MNSPEIDRDCCVMLIQLLVYATACSFNIECTFALENVKCMYFNTQDISR